MNCPCDLVNFSKLTLYDVKDENGKLLHRRGYCGDTLVIEQKIKNERKYTLYYPNHSVKVFSI